MNANASLENKCPSCGKIIPLDSFSCPNCDFFLGEEILYSKIKGGYGVKGPKNQNIRLGKIEATLDGVFVSSISPSAFSGCQNLASILIPDGIKVVGDSAFEGCSSLVTALLPSSVEIIGKRAFASCLSLSDLTLGDGLNAVGGSASCYCHNLTAMRYGGSLLSLGDASFTCTCGASSSSRKLERIEDESFAYCPSLKEVYVPEGVKAIGYGAFSYCKSLSKITLPSTLDKIISPFEGDTSLKEIHYQGLKSSFRAIYEKRKGTIEVICLDGTLRI